MRRRIAAPDCRNDRDANANCGCDSDAKPGPDFNPVGRSEVGRRGPDQGLSGILAAPAVYFLVKMKFSSIFARTSSMWVQYLLNPPL
jgi:hypothetical protein